MPHDDFGPRAPKRRRIVNESSVSRTEDYQHHYEPYGSSSGTLGHPTLASNGVSVQYEQFNLSGTVPRELHDNSLNGQYQWASMHASALPQTWASITEPTVPSYSEDHEQMLCYEAQPNKPLPTMFNPGIDDAPATDVAVIDARGGVAVCFGMVSQVPFFGVFCR
jgi:hypothetical protein